MCLRLSLPYYKLTVSLPTSPSDETFNIFYNFSKTTEALIVYQWLTLRGNYYVLNANK